jgi:hypothetical protein
LAKSKNFSGKSVDLERLSNRITSYLESEEFEVAFSKDSNVPARWYLVQARKISTLRTITGTRKSTDISIRGDPNSFEISISNGEWGKNLAASVPLIIVPVIGIGATLGKIYLGKVFENNLWDYVHDQISSLEGSYKNKGNMAADTISKSDEVDQSSRELPESNIDIRGYPSDYVRGYPGWDSPIEGGQLFLERNKTGKDRIIFKSPESKEFIMMAENISNIDIITRNNNDLLVEIDYKEEVTGKESKPVLNLSDNVIRGIMGGINEMIAEDREMKRIQQIKIIENSKYCGNCGYNLPSTAKFCLSCGTKQI